MPSTLCNFDSDKGGLWQVFEGTPNGLIEVESEPPEDDPDCVVGPDGAVDGDQVRVQLSAQLRSLVLHSVGRCWSAEQARRGGVRGGRGRRGGRGGRHLPQDEQGEGQAQGRRESCGKPHAHFSPMPASFCSQGFPNNAVELS